MLRCRKLVENGPQEFRRKKEVAFSLVFHKRGKLIEIDFN